MLLKRPKDVLYQTARSNWIVSSVCAASGLAGCGECLRWWENCLRAATNSVLLPETEPGTLREFFVVPAICGCEIAQAEGSGVWDREDAFQQLDVGNGLFRVHSISMIHNGGSEVKSRGTGTFVTAVLPVVLDRAWR